MPFRIERRYRQDSNVLEIVFITETGSARVTESLSSGVAGRLPWCELARRIEGISGTVEFEIVLAPICARGPVRRAEHPNGSVRYIGDLATTFCHDQSVEIMVGEDHRTVARVLTAEGSHTCIALLVADHAPLALPGLECIDGRIDLSDDEWRRWAQQLTYDGPFRDDLVRCALSLKFLVFSKTGQSQPRQHPAFPNGLVGTRTTTIVTLGSETPPIRSRRCSGPEPFPNRSGRLAGWCALSARTDRSPRSSTR